ncbi:hypothetical protein M9458_055222 [Cirrhinus mrigala]|uniref:Uncharacterized protein n=1 Tax=Cirrhinus mrigala TaxID=683832 RepID=A0ABD0MI00_CIRMR
MDNPAILLLLLEQGNRSLVDHTRNFVHLVPLTHYPDSSLCAFYRAGLNIATKALLSGDGPRESFADYIEWVLVSCRSSLTAEDDTSPTQDPEPNQPAPRHAEFEPEPTADDEPEPRATELKIATEPEPYTSDQVREPATATVTRECNMEQVRAMESPAHCTTAWGELDNDSGNLIDFSTEALENNWGLNRLLYGNTYLSHYTCLDGIPTHPPSMSTSVCAPLPPPVQWARHGLEDSSSPPPASESRTPPRPSDPAAPPRLSAPSSQSSPIGPPALPGSLIFLTPLDSVPPAAPRHAVPPAPKDSSLQHSLHPLPPDPRLLHHDSSFRRLHRRSSSWLRSGSPSASPAPGPSCFMFPPWLLPPSSPPRTMFCLFELSVRPWPPESPTYALVFFCMFYGVRRAYSEGGRNVTFMSVCLLVSPIVSPCRSVCFGFTLITVIPYTCVCN